MDGGLIRYNIYAHDKWIELKERCEKEGIILVGVIKDIKTSIIGDTMKDLNPNIEECFYDRELLFGQLDYGEIILIRDEVNKKRAKGIFICIFKIIFSSNSNRYGYNRKSKRIFRRNGKASIYIDSRK